MEGSFGGTRVILPPCIKDHRHLHQLVSPKMKAKILYTPTQLGREDLQYYYY